MKVWSCCRSGLDSPGRRVAEIVRCCNRGGISDRSTRTDFESSVQIARVSNSGSLPFTLDQKSESQGRESISASFHRSECVASSRIAGRCTLPDITTLSGDQSILTSTVISSRTRHGTGRPMYSCTPTGRISFTARHRLFCS